MKQTVQKFFTVKRTAGILFSGIMSILLCVSGLTGVYSANAASVPAPTSAGTVKTTSGNLNVRAAASATSSILGSLANGSYVSLIEKTGSFYKVIYANGKVGYCHADYIQPVTGSKPAYVSTSSTSLNVRSGPSTSYGVVGSVQKNADIIVLQTSGSFYKILYNGTQTGYASADYITLKQTAPAEPTVALSVPDYKQYDARWSSLRLGTSSKTIASSGCLTCAVAMERSFTYGYTVLPSNVASAAQYTSSGSLYWPSEYSFITGSNYLEEIKNKLLQGKPVIVGAKTSAGGQHWVIVTGYTPDGTLSADDFTINDPGSATRKTLAQYLSAYPIFYKAAYRR